MWRSCDSESDRVSTDQIAATESNIATETSVPSVGPASTICRRAVAAAAFDGVVVGMEWHPSPKTSVVGRYHRLGLSAYQPRRTHSTASNAAAIAASAAVAVFVTCRRLITTDSCYDSIVSRPLSDAVVICP